MRCVVVIPVFKPFEHLTSDELISLNQCFKILHAHPIDFFGPANLDITGYINFANSRSVKFSYTPFPDHFFKNIDGYSKLLMSRRYYSAYIQYEYLLIYQLDAYVFKDELLFWCDKGADYIGAPIFDRDISTAAKPEFLAVGNGGFSLRKVKTHLKILNTFSYLLPPTHYLRKFRPDDIGIPFLFRRVARLLLNATVRNNTYSLFNNFKGNEDIFWCLYVAKKIKWYKVLTAEEALSFSFEEYPDFLYEMNNNQLPFGCHAWKKYDPVFWEAFIPTSHQFKEIKTG
jgi:hypothetical protein